MQYASIFNDVLGPVMRGPSSSHCAAALRIGRICRDIVKARFDDILIEFDLAGSLATTHRSQGSDMGLFGGFLGYTADDERLTSYESAVDREGWNIHIAKRHLDTSHPNTYKMTFRQGSEEHQVTAISIGGGMIEVIQVDGADLTMYGDYHELLIYLDANSEVEDTLKGLLEYELIRTHRANFNFVQVKTGQKVEKPIIEKIESLPEVRSVSQIEPVLPVLSRKNVQVPFSTATEMSEFIKEDQWEIWQLALCYESARGNVSETEVYRRMRTLVDIMRKSISSGIRGTSYRDRILGNQSKQFQKKLEKQALIQDDLINRIILYVSAIMEVKSSMGVVIAAPTAGACAALPGAILGTADVLDRTEDDVVKAMLAAGLIGVFIAHQASFAAEVGGCQAECGSASSMAAAGLVALHGGTLTQALSAASQALQNSLGMICDPIANRVEAPCLGKNVMAATNALSCANMAMADYDHLIPLDQVIQTMAEVSEQMARELRCTGLGGLSATPAARDLEARMEGRKAWDGKEPLASSAAKFKIC